MECQRGHPEIAPVLRTGKLSNSHRLFIVSRAHIIKRLMPALAIVKDFDVLKDGTPGFITSSKRAVIDELIFQ
jgi:hypothetical protein